MSLQEKVQYFLGPLSAEITKAAYEALRQGDAESVGKLMTRAQQEFDKTPNSGLSFHN